MTLKIEKSFGFPLNDPKDFGYNDPILFYTEKFGGSDGGLLINLDSALKDSLKDLGELIFVAPLTTPMIVYFPAWEAYIQSTSQEFHCLHSRNNLELALDSETARSHHQYFSQVMKEHPLGGVLLRIYELQSSFPQARDKTLVYVRKQLDDQSLLGQFLSQTGGSECRLKQPYWRDEAGKWGFIEKFKRRLR